MSRYQKIAVRKGKWIDSPENPERNKRRQDRRDRREPKVTRVRVTNMEGHLRRAMAEEVGEAELSRDHRFALLQKFGLAAPRIDRKVTKPRWIGERQWNQQMNEWYKATKGLVPQSQSRQTKRPVRFQPRSQSSTAHTPGRAPSPAQFRHRSRSQSQQKQRGRNNHRPNPSLPSSLES